MRIDTRLYLTGSRFISMCECKNNSAEAQEYDK